MSCNTNFDKLMQEQIADLGGKKKILLHSCCGPCSTAVLERLMPYFDITILYFNPNIYPEGEYQKRLKEQQKVSKILDVKVVELEYNESEYLSAIKGLEGEIEGGKRCDECFRLRLQKTAKLAKEGGFDFFGTTLTVSSHKNAEHINRIGESIAKSEGIQFLYADFKKHDGYKRSIILSKQYDLYRQNYCGCRFSIR